MRQRRNFLLTLIVSIGVPMISGGDEVGRTQRGNNNGYCQDSTLTWTPWAVNDEDRRLYRFVQQLLTLRASQAVLLRRTFLRGRPNATDVLWLRPDGHEMTPADWNDAERRALGVLLDGHAIPETNAHGRIVTGDTLLILLNAGPDDVRFVMPRRKGSRWERVVDTADPEGRPRKVEGGAVCRVTGRSAAVFRHL
jgi:glycogen operon protein